MGLERLRTDFPRVRRIAFGDLFLADLRAYREQMLETSASPSATSSPPEQLPLLTSPMTDAAAPATLRTYEVHAETTETFGRVTATIREHRLTVDGPVQNGCPGEAPTPGELILAAAASCGAELMSVLARDGGMPLDGIRVTVRGSVDRANQRRDDVTVFNLVEIGVALHGPSEAQGAELVAGFQRRCPVYGSLAVASDRISVTHTVHPRAG